MVFNWFLQATRPTLPGRTSHQEIYVVPAPPVNRDEPLSRMAALAETLEEVLRDQLGVKLTPVKALVDVPLVDQVSEPKEN